MFSLTQSMLPTNHDRLLKRIYVITFSERFRIKMNQNNCSLFGDNHNLGAVEKDAGF